MDTEGRPSQIAVCAFTDCQALQAAIDGLLDGGFDRADLGLLDRAPDREDTSGRGIARSASAVGRGTVWGVHASSDAGGRGGGWMGRLSFFGAATTTAAIAMAGGSLALMAFGAASAALAGGLLGAELSRMFDERNAAVNRHRLRQGPLFLYARAANPGDAGRAIDVMRRHSGRVFPPAATA